MKFIDIAKITIKSGNGGKGHVSFRTEKFVPKGGPDGGNGGKGGSVIFKVDSHLNTLLDFKFNRIYAAGNGKPGGKARKTGKDGETLYIRIPQGTVIKRVDTDEIIADLSESDAEFVAAKGGKGGLGNSEFATSTNQAPRYAQPGIPGEEFEVVLELKLIADVGLVGLPNVGKSTLISVISEAKPKIADYPFTTLIPNLGIVRMADYQNYTVADIPGLIEGASDGKGLGIQFLRHVERTRALVFMIDSASSDPIADYTILRNELDKYNPEMNYKRRIICFTKSDTVLQEQLLELEQIDFGEPGTPKFIISSVTGNNVDKLKWAIWKMIEPAEN